MAVGREKCDQRQQAAQDQGDPTLDVEQKNLPTPSPRRSYHNTLVLLSGEGRGPHGHQRILPEPKPGPPAAENTQTNRAITTCSWNNT